MVVPGAYGLFLFVNELDKINYQLNFRGKLNQETPQSCLAKLVRLDIS